MENHSFLSTEPEKKFLFPDREINRTIRSKFTDHQRKSLRPTNWMQTGVPDKFLDPITPFESWFSAAAT